MRKAPEEGLVFSGPLNAFYVQYRFTEARYNLIVRFGSVIEGKLRRGQHCHCDSLIVDWSPNMLLSITSTPDFRNLRTHARPRHCIYADWA